MHIVVCTWMGYCLAWLRFVEGSAHATFSQSLCMHCHNSQLPQQGCRSDLYTLISSPLLTSLRSHQHCPPCRPEWGDNASREYMKHWQRHLFVLLGYGDESDVTSYPTTATKCSVCMPDLPRSQARRSPIQLLIAILIAVCDVFLCHEVIVGVVHGKVICIIRTDRHFVMRWCRRSSRKVFCLIGTDRQTVVTKTIHFPDVRDVILTEKNSTFLLFYIDIDYIDAKCINISFYILCWGKPS